MARKIQAGSIVVNGGGGEGPLPFGGFKQSGLGRENGREGVLSYTEIKAVSMGL
jgi:acyl-CoA reductase-like NAD-dependent aldehyde dehydrogenase